MELVSRCILPMMVKETMLGQLAALAEPMFLQVVQMEEDQQVVAHQEAMVMAPSMTNPISVLTMAATTHMEDMVATLTFPKFLKA